MDGEGQSPLHYAARMGDVDMVQALLALGASASIKDDSDQSAMHLAAV